MSSETNVKVEQQSLKNGIRPYRYFRERNATDSALPRKAPFKLIIKNARPVDPDGNQARRYVAEMTAKLMAALDRIFFTSESQEALWESQTGFNTGSSSGSTVPFSLEELYRGVENLCRYGNAEILWEKVKQRMSDHALLLEKRAMAFNSQYEVLLNDGSHQHLISYSKKVIAEWDGWLNRLNLARCIFFYLDRTFVINFLGNHSIFQEGIRTCYRPLFFKYWRANLTVAFRNICADRLLHPTNSQYSSLAKSIAQLFRTISDDTDDEYFKDLAKHACVVLERRATSQPIETAEDCFTVMQQVNSVTETSQLLCQELGYSTARSNHLVRSLTDILFTNRCNSIYLHMWELTKPAIKYFQLYHDIVETTSRRADHPDHPGDKLTTIYGEQIAAQITRIVEDTHLSTNSMVKQLIEMQRLVWLFTSSQMWISKGSEIDLVRNLGASNLDVIATGSSGIEDKLATQMRRKFGDTIRDAPWETRLAEKLAKYTEELMRTTIKTASTEELVNGQFADVMAIFRELASKDIFEAFYKKDVARRLLQNKIVSHDAEQAFILLLKQECGSSYTQRLECMFKDMEVSKTYQTGFRTYEGATPGPSFSINMLTQGKWPTYPDTKVTIPQQLQKQTVEFENYYNTKHENRVLKWQPGLGHCVIRARFATGVKELSMPLLQAVVLLVFQSADNDWIVYSDLKASTGMDDVDLKRCLHSFTLGKVKVLIKDHPGKIISNTDQFKVNDNINEKATRLKISNINVRTQSSGDESFSSGAGSSGAVPDEVQTLREVARDRSMEIQATIMRILKARKTISHVDLVQQSIEQTQGRGRLSVASIKVQIESLLNRSYMERQEGSSDVYIYS